MSGTVSSCRNRITLLESRSAEVNDPLSWSCTRRGALCHEDPARGLALVAFGASLYNSSHPQTLESVSLRLRKRVAMHGPTLPRQFSATSRSRSLHRVRLG